MKHMKDSSSSFTIVVMYAFIIVVSDGLISGCWFPTCLTKISCLIIPLSSMKGKKTEAGDLWTSSFAIYASLSHA